MVDKEKVIKGLELCNDNRNRDCTECPYNDGTFFCAEVLMRDALAMIKDQEAVYQGTEELLRQTTILFSDAIERLKEHETEWEHLWDAPDGTYKGRCKKCGFVHFFIEGHNEQYKYCPECGRSVKWDD